MKRQILFSLIATAFIAFLTACGGTSVSPRPSLLVGDWMVTKASFGSEESMPDMYKNYEISFEEDGTYNVKNPDGAPSLALSTANSGKYELEPVNNNQLTFDRGAPKSGTHTVIILDATKMITETYVTLPGKLRTLYRFELARK